MKKMRSELNIISFKSNTIKRTIEKSSDERYLCSIDCDEFISRTLTAERGAHVYIFFYDRVWNRYYFIIQPRENLKIFRI